MQTDNKEYNQRLSQILNTTEFSDTVRIDDHIYGFDANLRNTILDHVSAHVDKETVVETFYIIDDTVKKKYPQLRFILSQQECKVFEWLNDYNIHPPINYNNFICSFNGTPHVSRKLLVSALEKFGWFRPTHSTKNFSVKPLVLDGHISDLVDREDFYRKFFSFDEMFLREIYSVDYRRYDHMSNIKSLEQRLTSSFVHVVSETMATAYYPFFSEKSFYSIVTRGLFLSYAQPGWHDHFEKYLGFKKYNKLFDYRFDSIQNPVERLIELLSMLAKFSNLTTDDWRDLYNLESDTIEYNYDHYFSRRYLDTLKLYE